jgi:cation diffusion facilitator family transporter
MLKNLKGRILIPIISLVLGVVLLAIKFYAYYLTNSQAIFSDALESIINVVAALSTITVIFIAAKPADEDHPYGHGKAESMAATFEGSAITIAGLIVVYESISALFHPKVLEEISTGLILTIVAGTLNGLMGLILVRRGKKLHSDALKSSGTHLLGDALTSLGVIASLIIVKFTGMQWVDPVIGALFGFFLCFSGFKILIHSGNVLLDSYDKTLLDQLLELFEKHRRPGVIHIHHTRIIRSGSFHHIECHMVVPEFWTVAEAHDFSEAFEADLISDYPVNGELRMHLDPCRSAYCRNCELADCPIREAAFVKRHHFSFEEITSPTESI